MKEFEIHYVLKNNEGITNIYTIKEATEIERARKEFNLFCEERKEALMSAELIERTTIITKKNLLKSSF